MSHLEVAESVLQICMDVLMSQHFIGDPVEDVEYEKAQGKDSSRYGVNAFSPVHKTLVNHSSVVHSNWRRGGEHGGPLHSGTILGLQAVTQSITPEVKTAALPHQFLLLWSQAEARNRLASCCLQELAYSFLRFRSEADSRTYLGCSRTKG